MVVGVVVLVELVVELDVLVVVGVVDVLQCNGNRIVQLCRCIITYVDVVLVVGVVLVVDVVEVVDVVGVLYM